MYGGRLSVFGCLFSVVCYSLSVICCLFSVVCFRLSVFGCLFSVVCYSLFVVHHSLFLLIHLICESVAKNQRLVCLAVKQLIEVGFVLSLCSLWLNDY